MKTLLVLLLLALPAAAQFGNATRLQNRNVSPTAPSNGQAICWNSTTNQWTPAACTNAGPTGATGATGAAGTNGNTVLNGTAAPTTEGVNGDYYLRTSTSCLYGPKAAGSWPGSCTSLIGPTGPTGATGAAGTNGNLILSGSGLPSGGANGDYYIRTSTNCLYGPKAAGSWPGTCTSLVGPTGAAGAGFSGIGSYATMQGTLPTQAVVWIMTDAPTPGYCGAGGGANYSVCAYDFGVTNTWIPSVQVILKNTYAAMVASSPVTNDLWLVTDASTTGTCSTGGGTARSICAWTGSAWVPTSGGGGGISNAMTWNAINMTWNSVVMTWN